MLVCFPPLLLLQLRCLLVTALGLIMSSAYVEVDPSTPSGALGVVAVYYMSQQFIATINQGSVIPVILAERRL